MLKSTNHYSQSHSFKDHYRERQLLINRCIVAFGIVTLMLLVLLARSWYLQVVKFEDYQTRSESNHITVQPIAPKRGLIYDRNGVLLAENRSIYALEIIPEQVKDLDDTLNRLIEYQLIEEKHKKKFIDYLRGQRRFKSISVKNQMNEQEVARFSVIQHQFPGVRVEAHLVRHYPFAEKVVHALGRVGRINDRELNQIDQANYKATRHIGKVGLEKYYEELLHGKIGFRKVETNVQGRVIGKPLFVEPPVPGKNLRLSLDIRLQQVATKAMGDAQGSVVAIDPRNGEVLMLVSNPGYDPNKFVTGISVTDYKKISQSTARPLFNRALRGLYSPGSTIKPHLAWIGLEKKIITTKSSVYDPGYWVIPNEEGRVYRDHKKTGHGNAVTLLTAIVKSCDPYFYDLAYRMGIDTLSEQMKQFGFGDYTGIDMGEEVPGIMPSREWKIKSRKVPWFPGETVITGIGQGYWIATPLQFANAIGQLGAGSERFNLHLVREYQTAEGWRTVQSVAAESQPDFSDRKNLNEVQDAMLKVTKFGGTAFEAFKDAPYESGGKTGTVQLKSILQDEEYDEKKIEKRFRDNAVYVGYAPFNNPEIAIAVVVENAGHGGAKAAPIARKLMDEYFKNQKLDSSKKQNQIAVNNENYEKQ